MEDLFAVPAVAVYIYRSGQCTRTFLELVESTYRTIPHNHRRPEKEVLEKLRRDKVIARDESLNQHGGRRVRGELQGCNGLIDGLVSGLLATGIVRVFGALSITVARAALSRGS